MQGYHQILPTPYPNEAAVTIIALLKPVMLAILAFKHLDINIKIYRCLKHLSLLSLE